MGQPADCAAGAVATGAAGAGAAVAAAGAAAVTGAACWGCWTCTGEPLGSAMMLPEETRRTRRPGDDLPLETSLPSPPTPLSRRTPSPPPPPEPATRGGSEGGRAGRREEAAPAEAGRGGGGPLAALAARPEPRARSSLPPRGEPPPRRPLLPDSLPGSFHPRGAGPGWAGFRDPRSSPLTPRFPRAFAPDSRALRKMSLGDPEGGVAEPPPGSQIQKVSASKENLKFIFKLASEPPTRRPLKGAG